MYNIILICYFYILPLKNPVNEFNLLLASRLKIKNSKKKRYEEQSNWRKLIKSIILCIVQDQF